MQGRRGLGTPLHPFVDNPERILHSHRSSTTMADMDPPPPPPVHPRPLREYFIPTDYVQASCIRRPDVGAPHYEIKASIIQMLPSFYGLSHEDPYRHLDEFLEICSTVKIQNFDDDALRLTLFPFSLKDKAKYWLKSLDSVEIE